MSIQDVDADVEGAGDSSPPMVPLSALQAERGKRQALEVKFAGLEGKVDGLSQVQKPQHKEYTRAELQAAVDDGRTSQEAADRLLEEQSVARIDQRVSANQEARDRTSKINAEIALYRQFKPEIAEDGSAAREVLKEAYVYQMNTLGKPDNALTELDALIQVYGPASKLQNGRAKALETHQETAGGGGDETAGTDSWPKDMPARHRQHYESQINKGVLTKEAAKKQWAYKPKHGPR